MKRLHLIPLADNLGEALEAEGKKPEAEGPGGVLKVLRDLFSPMTRMTVKRIRQKFRRYTLDQLRRQYRGARYAQLINEHLSRQPQSERIAGIVGSIAMLPGAVRPHVEDFIDRWNIRGYEAEFWNEDAAQVLDEITSDAQRLLDRIGVAADDETLLNLFHIMTLSYACSAYDQPKRRAFMGIPDYRA